MFVPRNDGQNAFATFYFGAFGGAVGGVAGAGAGALDGVDAGAFAGAGALAGAGFDGGGAEPLSTEPGPL